MSQQPPRGALCQRCSGISEREREAPLQQSVGWLAMGGGGGYWITECPSRTVVKAIDTNREAGRSKSLPRQTDKQINKRHKDSPAGVHSRPGYTADSVPTERCVFRLSVKSKNKVSHVLAVNSMGLQI